MAASTLRLSNTYLGAQFRRLRTKLGAPVAIKAMAAKLPRLVYRMLRYGMPFIDRGAEFYDASTANCKLIISSAKPPISDSKSSKLRQRVLEREDFDAEKTPRPNPGGSNPPLSWLCWTGPHGSVL
jgi:hypothetical protein